MSFKSKVKKPNIQTTTLTDFFPKESQKNVSIPSVEQKVERSDSFYDICVLEELNRLQNEKLHVNTQNGVVAEASDEMMVHEMQYSTNDGTMEHKISDIDVETSPKQVSSKCTNKECIGQVCIYPLNLVSIPY